MFGTHQLLKECWLNKEMNGQWRETLAAQALYECRLSPNSFLVEQKIHHVRDFWKIPTRYIWLPYVELQKLSARRKFMRWSSPIPSFYRWDPKKWNNLIVSVVPFSLVSVVGLKTPSWRIDGDVLWFLGFSLASLCLSDSLHSLY